MSRGARIALIAGAVFFSALSGPRSVVNLWNGLRGPYANDPGTRVAAEVEDEVSTERDEGPR